MKVDGVPHRTLWVADDGWSVEIIDQTRLPHAFVTRQLRSARDAAQAIRTMQVRGAPLIGVTAAYGMCLQAREDASPAALESAARMLLETRPTAVNLRWALAEMSSSLNSAPAEARCKVAYERAAALADEDAALCHSIGENGLPLLEKASVQARKQGRDTLQVLTHCNAGWLATVDWGTALAPVYLAHDRGIALHVWVDETRPRNQGASLTAWELGQHGVPHTVIADNAGGHLMQQGRVDLCITGSDRAAANGDVCNKIGTYLKALAAKDNDIPFYVAFPYSTIDWKVHNGREEIPIEERDARELSHVTGRTDAGELVTVALLPEGSAAENPAFDITPARLVTALITERGVCEASAAGLAGLYPERQPRAG